MEEYKIWLQKAKDDLHWTSHSLEDGIWYGACFTSQQGAEKALKSFLFFRQQPLRKVHDLSALLNECIALDAGFEQLRLACATLTPYYISTRYPLYEDLTQFSEQDAKQAYTFAQAVISFVESKLVV